MQTGDSVPASGIFFGFYLHLSCTTIICCSLGAQNITSNIPKKLFLTLYNYQKVTSTNHSRNRMFLKRIKGWGVVRIRAEEAESSCLLIQMSDRKAEPQALSYPICKGSNKRNNTNKLTWQNLTGSHLERFLYLQHQPLMKQVVKLRFVKHQEPRLVHMSEPHTFSHCCNNEEPPHSPKSAGNGRAFKKKNLTQH